MGPQCWDRCQLRSVSGWVRAGVMGSAVPPVPHPWAGVTRGIGGGDSGEGGDELLEVTGRSPGSWRQILEFN